MRSIVALGRSLRLPITAEGIETSQIFAKVRELGCTDAQGWLFGRAMTIRGVEGIIAKSAGTEDLSLSGGTGRRARGS